MKHVNFRFLLGFTFFTCSYMSAQEVVGVVENASDQKPISAVHVINLNKVSMSITNEKGVFIIPAEVNDTLFFSYLGYKSIKVRVTNDLIKYPNSTFQLTRLYS